MNKIKITGTILLVILSSLIVPIFQGMTTNSYAADPPSNKDLFEHQIKVITRRQLTNSTSGSFDIIVVEYQNKRYLVSSLGGIVKHSEMQ